MPSPTTETGSTTPTIYLPDATSSDWFTPATSSAPAQSKLLRIKRQEATSGSTVTVRSRVNGQTVDNAATKTLTGLQGICLASDGANWWTV